MTRSATATVELRVSCVVQNTLEDGSVAKATVGRAYLNDDLADGVEASQCNRALQYQGSLAENASLDMDLYDYAALDLGAGAGLDGLGQTLTIEEIVLIMIKQTGGTGRLEIQRTTPSNPVPWAPVLTVANGGALRSGGVVLMYNPGEDALDVEEASEDTLRLTATGGTATFTVLILGKHDDDTSSSSTSSSASSSSNSSSVSSSSSRSSSSTT